MFFHCSGKSDENVLFDSIRPVQGEYLVEKSYGDLDKYFNDAIREYDSLVDSFGNEKPKGNADAKQTFGEQALESAIRLALSHEKQVTASRLIEKYLEVYPNGGSASEFNQKLNDFYSVDSSLAGSVINLDDG